MTKYKPIIIIFAAFFAFFIFVSVYFPNVEMKVKQFDAEITLDANGDMTMNETWIVDFPNGYSVTFRDIAYNKYNSGNPLYQESANRAFFDEGSVSIEVYGSDNTALVQDVDYEVGYSFNGDLDELGQPIECYPSRSECESLFVWVYDGMDDRMTFVYDYKITGVITEYNDVSELNWRLIDANYVESGISDSTVTINVPGVTADQLMAWGHGLGKGRVTVEDETVTLEMDRIKYDEFLEFRILIDEDIFTVDAINHLDVAARQEIIDYEQELARTTNLGIAIATILLIGSFAVLVLMAMVATKIYFKYDKEYTPEYSGKYYRELPAEYTPAEMSYLYYFGRIQNEDVTATLLDLVRRKILTLDTNQSGINDRDPNFKIKKNPDADFSTLLPHEQHLINWFINLVGNNSEVTINEIEQYPKKSYTAAMAFEKEASMFITKAKQSGSRHDFFEKGLAMAKSKLYAWVLLPLICFGIALITDQMEISWLPVDLDNTLAMIVSGITAAAYLMYIASIKKRSKKGNEDFTKWKAFRQFLLDFGNMDDYPIPGIVVWEHYLVYATSLKVADKVMQQLEVKLPVEQLETDSSSTYMGFGYRYYGFRLGYALGRINRSVATARTNGRATIAAHQAKSSGFGRGGGFSGGSSFGGGGGGFRGR